MEDAKFEEIEEKYVQFLFEFHEYVDAMLKELDDAELKDLVERGRREELRDRANRILVQRVHYDRAKRSGEDVYCVFHACGASKCPAGSHGEWD